MFYFLAAISAPANARVLVVKKEKSRPPRRKGLEDPQQAEEQQVLNLSTGAYLRFVFCLLELAWWLSAAY